MWRYRAWICARQAYTPFLYYDYTTHLLWFLHDKPPLNHTYIIVIHGGIILIKRLVRSVIIIISNYCIRVSRVSNYLVIASTPLGELTAKARFLARSLTDQDSFPLPGFVFIVSSTANCHGNCGQASSTTFQSSLSCPRIKPFLSIAVSLGLFNI